MPNETAPNPLNAKPPHPSDNQTTADPCDGARRQRRETIDEVTAAKLALLNLRREPRDPTALVRKHPLAITGVAFALGLLIGKSPTARTLGRAGIVLGMRGAIARAIREVI